MSFLIELVSVKEKYSLLFLKKISFTFNSLFLKKKKNFIHCTRCENTRHIQVMSKDIEITRSVSRSRSRSRSSSPHKNKHKMKKSKSKSKSKSKKKKKLNGKRSRSRSCSPSTTSLKKKKTRSESPTVIIVKEKRDDENDDKEKKKKEEEEEKDKKQDMDITTSELDQKHIDNKDNGAIVLVKNETPIQLNKIALIPRVGSENSICQMIREFLYRHFEIDTTSQTSIGNIAPLSFEGSIPIRTISASLMTVLQEQGKTVRSFLELETRLGVLMDNSTGQRLELPIMGAAVMDQSSNVQCTFNSGVSEVAILKLRNLLNDLMSGKWQEPMDKSDRPWSGAPLFNNILTGTLQPMTCIETETTAFKFSNGIMAMLTSNNTKLSFMKKTRLFDQNIGMYGQVKPSLDVRITISDEFKYDSEEPPIPPGKS